jgi:cytochrome c oxidase assembly factor CtaG
MTTFLAAWRVDLFVAVNLLLAAAWYLWAVRRVRTAHPGARWHWGLTTSFLAGIALLSLMYLGPMAAWSHTFFWVHMTQHLVVTMAAAPLLVLGAPITLAFRASGPRNRRAMVRVLRGRVVRVMTNPILTWLLFAGVLLGAHFTPFYNWALTNHGASILVEQPMFLVVAMLYYLPLIGTNLLPRRPTHAVRLISLGLMMIPEALIGAVIYFSPVVLYPAFDVERPFGLAALPDQQLSGALMWALVMVVDAFWMMWVAAEWFASEERRGRRISAEIAAEVTAG